MQYKRLFTAKALRTQRIETRMGEKEKRREKLRSKAKEKRKEARFTAPATRIVGQARQTARRPPVPDRTGAGSTQRTPRLKAKEKFNHGIPRTKDAEDIARKITEFNN